MKQAAFFLTALAFLWLAVGSCFADADSAWQGVLKLEESPPANDFSSREEARRVILERLNRQEKALNRFVGRFPLDDRVIDAQLRLARVMAVQSDLLPDPEKFAASMVLLDELEKKQGMTAERLADVSFARLGLQMSRIQMRDERSKEWLTISLREIQKKHPGDKRIPKLIVEVSSFYDTEPKAKAKLLYEALRLARDDELKFRISDDLKRLDLLGRKVPLKFVSSDGNNVALSDFRGAVVIVYFFADWSPPSVAGLAELQAVLRKYPESKVRAIGISLDASPETAKRVLDGMKLSMPVMCDGKSWEGELVRKFGINVLPTVWLFDRQGHLRMLNARDSLDTHVRDLIRER